MILLQKESHEWNDKGWEKVKKWKFGITSFMNGPFSTFAFFVCFTEINCSQSSVEIIISIWNLS